MSDTPTDIETIRSDLQRIVRRGWWFIYAVVIFEWLMVPFIGWAGVWLAAWGTWVLGLARGSVWLITKLAGQRGNHL